MPVPTMPAKIAAAAAPPPRYARRRALKSVAPFSSVAVERPRPDAAEPPRAGGGLIAVIAKAATVAMTAVRPIDENTAFRANILDISIIAWRGKPAYQPASLSWVPLSGFARLTIASGNRSDLLIDRSGLVHHNGRWRRF